MDTSRIILLLAIGLVGMMLLQEWEKDYGQPVEIIAEKTSTSQEASKDDDIPNIALLDKEKQSFNPITTENSISDNQLISLISVKTDVYEMQISTLGASIQTLSLLNYPKEHAKPHDPLVFLNNTDELYYILQGGLRGKADLPTNNSLYSSAESSYELQQGQESLDVDFTWVSDDVKVTKTYTFHRDRYVVDVNYTIENISETPIKLAAYSQLQRDNPKEGRKLLYTYTGAILSTPENRYEKWTFDDLEKKKIAINEANAWVAMDQHYFVSALFSAKKDEKQQYYSIASPEKNRYYVGTMTTAVDIEPGNQQTISQKAYIGPKEQKRLKRTLENLDLVVNYWYLWFIAEPLFDILNWFHTITGNWGWSIILITIAIKLIFYIPSAAGYRSMANMRRVQPRIMSIRERYSNDRNRLNQAMMDLYKEEKINPIGGCLPILIQIPVFIALYWVLLESVEMRQAPFMLWLQDLSSPDPLYVLPLLMGVTMFVQQKLNPPPMDPVQQKVMSFLPVVFTVFFAFFPSGLVLYWVSNNILSIIQQARINHTLTKAGLK